MGRTACREQVTETVMTRFFWYLFNKKDSIKNIICELNSELNSSFSYEDLRQGYYKRMGSTAPLTRTAIKSASELGGFKAYVMRPKAETVEILERTIDNFNKIIDGTIARVRKSCDSKGVKFSASVFLRDENCNADLLTCINRVRFLNKILKLAKGANSEVFDEGRPHLLTSFREEKRRFGFVNGFPSVSECTYSFQQFLDAKKKKKNRK